MRYGKGPQGTPHITVTTPEGFPEKLTGKLIGAITDAALRFEDEHPDRDWQLFCLDRES